MNVTLRTVDDRPVLRFERRLAHSPEKVWRAITEPGHLNQWYPFRAVEMDLRIGGTISFDGGGGTILDGVVTALEPPRVFAFSQHAGKVLDREGENLLHFELRPDGEGCLLIFTHTFDDRPHAAANAAGWQGCLDALEMVLDARPVEAANNWVELHEAYIEAFGLNVGSAEVNPDGWRVRFERQLMQQPIDKVWAALTAPGSDAPTPDAGAPAVGGPVPQAFTTPKVPSGAVTAVDEPTLLEYDWRSGDRGAGRVRWELSSTPAGARIILTQTGPSALAEQRSAAQAAWQTHIEGLAKQLRGASR